MNYLLVPIRVDALYLENDQPVSGAMANFSRLPHWIHESGVFTDFHSDVPFLSESILTSPFEDQRLYLKKGLHLHWALPDMLTRSRQRRDGLPEGMS